MPIAQKLATALHRFNAKERNFLMRFALLGEVDPGDPTQSTNWVNSNFFRALKCTLEAGPTDGNPSGPLKLSAAAHCVYAAMDYHLDWLLAALWCVGSEWDPGAGADFIPEMRHPHNPDEPAHSKPHQQDVMGNQEDVDLLLVIEDGDTTHLVLVEAKGVSSFGETQLRSKLKRLQLILREDRLSRVPRLLVSMVFLSPKRRAMSAVDAVTVAREYMRDITGARAYTMEMPNFPAKRVVVTRCDKDGENPKGSKRENRQRELTHWKVR